MKHLVYKITNKINGKYYIGVHSTKNINDKYLGCGHWYGRKISNITSSPILNAFKKYGENNFIKEILFIFDNRNDALLKEQQLVNINDTNCYNARTGGGINYRYSNDVKVKMSQKAKQRSIKNLLQTNILKEYNNNKKGKTYTEIYGEEKSKQILHKKSLAASGKKHSLSSKKKMSLQRKGKDCGKCKGRAFVYDETTKKLKRYDQQIINELIIKGKIIEECKVISKFRTVKYIQKI